jgi:hypothetical protein
MIAPGSCKPNWRLRFTILELASFVALAAIVMKWPVLWVPALSIALIYAFRKRTFSVRETVILLIAACALGLALGTLMGSVKGTLLGSVKGTLLNGINFRVNPKGYCRCARYWRD